MSIQLKKVRVWVDIEVPEGATHYFGGICGGDINFCKFKMNALGGKMWFVYKINPKTNLNAWMYMYDSEETPHFCKSLRDVIL